MKNKLIIGLLLIAQVSGVMAKGSNENESSFSPAQMKKDAEIKAEGSAYQEQLKTEYNAYVANVNPYFNFYSDKQASLASLNAQLAAVQKNERQNERKIIELSEEIEMTKMSRPPRIAMRRPLSFTEWLRSGRPQR